MQSDSVEGNDMQSRVGQMHCCHWEGVAHRVRTAREHSTVRTAISCAEPRMYVSNICQAHCNRMNMGMQ